MERKQFRMTCPRCQYRYWYEGETEELDRWSREWETCPICGYGCRFDDFVQEVKEIKLK